MLPDPEQGSGSRSTTSVTLSPEATLSSSAEKRAPNPVLATHTEKHTGNTALVRDAIIGFADGLTVPFALTAGLSSVGSSRLVVIGGLAELFAGAISMGLGAYLACLTDAKHYKVEEQRERREVVECPLAEEEEIYEILAEYHISRTAANPVVDGLKANPEAWVAFMMKFELGLERPETSRAYISALVMGMSYFIGGIIPMIPYLIIKGDVDKALFVSIGITVVMLLAFGYTKAVITGTNKRDAGWSAVQTLAVGAAAAGVSYGIVKGIQEAAPVSVH